MVNVSSERPSQQLKRRLTALAEQQNRKAQQRRRVRVQEEEEKEAEAAVDQRRKAQEERVVNQIRKEQKKLIQGLYQPSNVLPIHKFVDPLTKAANKKCTMQKNKIVQRKNQQCKAKVEQKQKQTQLLTRHVDELNNRLQHQLRQKEDFLNTHETVFRKRSEDYWSMVDSYDKQIMQNERLAKQNESLTNQIQRLLPKNKQVVHKLPKVNQVPKRVAIKNIQFGVDPPLVARNAKPVMGGVRRR